MEAASSLGNILGDVEGSFLEKYLGMVFPSFRSFGVKKTFSAGSMWCMWDDVEWSWSCSLPSYKSIKSSLLSFPFPREIIFLALFPCAVWNYMFKLQAIRMKRKINKSKQKTSRHTATNAVELRTQSKKLLHQIQENFDELVKIQWGGN